MKSGNDHSGWKQTRTDIFWGEIAPCEHVLQIYESEGVFIDALAGFVGGGINSNDACIVIATDIHLKALESRLESYGIQIPTLISERRYIPLNAEETLSKFMKNGWPDENLFILAISELLKRARGRSNRRIRAFGEMVAILWAQGYIGATVQLEHIWNRFCEKEEFGLFCAYPKAGFTEDMTDSIKHVCSAHSKMIGGSEKQLTTVFYKETEHRQAI
jgi:hypothetical protein